MTAALLLADEPTGIDGIAGTGRIGAERIREEPGTIPGAEYETVNENCIRDKLFNDKMIQGMMMI